MLYDGPGDLVKVFDGPNYGPLWVDRYPLALVVHTTETLSRPGYSGGSSAPQITIDPARERVYQHQPLDDRAGSLRGTRRVYQDTGVWAVMNEKAVQVEIIGYSDRNAVLKHKGGRRWVGDFAAADYEFIAAVVAYLKDLFGIGDALHARPSGKSWAYGISSPYRMGAEQWSQFSGLTAHGGVFGQDHWDTGVLDLHRLWTPDQGEDEMTPEEKAALADIVKLRQQADPSKALAGAWSKGLEDGLLTEHSRPGAIVTDERSTAFLYRWKELVRKELRDEVLAESEARTKKLIAAAIAGGALGGAGVAELFAEIARRLGG